MIFNTNRYQIEITEEPYFNADSTDNLFKFRKRYLSKSELYVIQFGIKISENGTLLNSAIIGAEGGTSGLHKTSQIIEDNRLLICCANSVFCLEISTLNLLWKTKVDDATAIQIFKINDGYIVHGELEITRLATNGNSIWQNAGADIFVTDSNEANFEIKDKIIFVKDWQNRTYKWDLNGNEIK